jgi:hypothetical protein
VVFSFKIALDDYGLRLREPMRFFEALDQGEGMQFKLDL